MSRHRCEDSQGPSEVTITLSKGFPGRAGTPLAHLGWPLALSGMGTFTHRIVAEELTVAAVTELPISLVCGGRGAGATL